MRRSWLEHSGGDLVLDRRGSPRRGDAPPQPDRFTAASHRPLPLVFALGCAGRWAVVKGLSIGPGGVLVHLVDPTDPELDPRDRVGAATWMRLARHAHPMRPPSPLWLSSCCVGAPRLVAELSRAATERQAIELELVALARHAASAQLPSLRCVGMLAPLVDPSPAVLGVALCEADLARLAAFLPAVHARVPGPEAGAPALSQPAGPALATVASPAPHANTGAAPKKRRVRTGRRRAADAG